MHFGEFAEFTEGTYGATLASYGPFSAFYFMFYCEQCKMWSRDSLRGNNFKDVGQLADVPEMGIFPWFILWRVAQARVR